MKDSFNENFMRRSWRGVPLLNEYSDALRIRERVRKLGQAVGAYLDLRPTRQGEWVVFQRIGTKEQLVGKYPTLDDRIVKRLEQILHPSYNLSKDLEVTEDAYAAQQARERDELTGTSAEALAYHTRRLTGHVDHVYFPHGLSDSVKPNAV